jgi:hypothetical protein
MIGGDLLMSAGGIMLGSVLASILIGEVDVEQVLERGQTLLGTL